MSISRSKHLRFVRRGVYCCSAVAGGFIVIVLLWAFPPLTWPLPKRLAAISFFLSLMLSIGSKLFGRRHLHSKVQTNSTHAIISAV